MPQLLLILDDDRARLRGFDEIAPRLGSEWVIRAWRNAPSMMAEIDALLGQGFTIYSYLANAGLPVTAQV